MTDWNAHTAAVDAAKSSVLELQYSVGLAITQAEETLGVVMNAVGDTTTDSGDSAKRFVAHVKDELLPEVIRTLERVKEELDSYGGGF